MTSFKADVIKQAKLLKNIIIFPEPDDERVLAAAAVLQKKGIVIPILIGNPEKVTKVAAQASINIKGLQLIDPFTSNLTEQLATEFYKRRRRKGMTPAKAAELIHDPFVFGAMLVQKDMAHGMVCGATRPTRETIRAAAWCVGKQPGVRIASSMFFMDFPKEVLLFADCGFNIDPTPRELVDIAEETVVTAKAFDLPQRVALLSFSTQGSAQHDSVKKVQRATKMVKTRNPKLQVDGELQFDAAYVPAVQKRKAPKSSLKGEAASIFVFPDLNSGNICYKVAERLGGAQAYGPIMQGFAKPINDLSRGCSVDDIVVVAAITAVQGVQAK